MESPARPNGPRAQTEGHSNSNPLVCALLTDMYQASHQVESCIEV